jgi:8-oxo-dGTP diphosphatase
VVTHRHRVLFGRRESTAGLEWQLPGGWIETGESPRQAARREVLEETGLELGELEFVGITSNQFSTRNHSISLYFEAECLDARALTSAEIDKCRAWEWKPWVEVSDNLFLPLRLFRQTGYQPFSRDGRQTYVSI